MPDLCVGAHHPMQYQRTVPDTYHVSERISWHMPWHATSTSQPDVQAAAAQGSGGVTGIKRAKTGNAPGDFGRFTYSGGSAGAPRRVPTSFSGGAAPLQGKVRECSP